MNKPANDHRRETPLLAVLREAIARDGPMPVHEYARTCLLHPEHGYYVAQRAIGADGDFITAPEISQIFGELIGLWVAVTWQTMGQTPGRFGPVRLMEIGPGRGTLMSDALRALTKMPDLLPHLSVELVEINPRLRAAQKERLASSGAALQWHSGLESLPRDGALILVANEFLDTLPAMQYVVTPDGIGLRTVTLDVAGALCYGHAPAERVPADIAARLRDAAVGTVAEDFPAPDALLRTLARDNDRPAAALLIDYGHESPGVGETLQAVRGHAFEDILTSPGEADLSVQVDFSGVTAAARAQGLAVDGPLPQAEFLGHLGILQRASRLMAANPASATDIEAGVLRLMAPNGMGTRFKAIGLRSPSLPPLAGFARLDQN